MSVIRIATRYAKSLIDLAIEQGKLEPVYSDVMQLQAAAKNRELYLFLKSPIVHSDKKIAVLDALFKGKVDALTLTYLHLLVTKNREMYIPEIAAEFVHQYKTLEHISSVTVTSALPLGDAVLEGLRQKLLASGILTENLEIIAKVDPELIGGFILEFNNKRYDASVASKLADLRSDFLKNQYIREF